tara:strand:- start:4135 stop:4524 length:390 start_codon:yes stop_codon:yes gene_type:complete
MIKDNWTFYIINPFDKNFSETTQKIYNINYNKSFEKLIDELCIPEPSNILDKEFNFIHFINCDKENDIINNDDLYNYKFLKSKFFETKLKLIINKLNTYYFDYGIEVNRIYKVALGYNIEISFIKNNKS